MALRLTITDRRDPQHPHMRGFVQSRVVIGRAKICDVCLPDLTVSSIHAELRLDATAVTVVDLGSMNGTVIEGRRLIPHRPRKIRSGDAIDIAGYQIRLEQGPFPGTALSSDESMRHAREMLRAILANRGGLERPPVIMAVSGPGKGARCVLQEGIPAIIGRNREHALRVEDGDVSRMHAEVCFENGRISVVDLGSRNGLVKDGARLDRFELGPDESFTAGSTVFALENPIDPELQAIQEAPESDTSSYFSSEEWIAGPPTAERIDVRAFAAGDAPGPDDTSGTSASDAVSELPIGPRDPLVGVAGFSGPAGAEAQDFPRRASPENGPTDLGLIVVGAIIVIASVAALIWLFS